MYAAMSRTISADKLAGAIEIEDKTERDKRIQELRDEVIAKFAESYSDSDVEAVFDSAEKRHVRSRILEHGMRPDGRDLTTIRPISCAVGLLPRTHGSGLFTRGQTQVLTIATLGSVADEQKIDRLGLNEKQALHAPLQHAALLHRRGSAHARPRPPRDRPRRAGRARPGARPTAARTTSPTPSVS